MQLVNLLPLLLGAVLVGVAIGVSNSTEGVKQAPSVNQSVSNEVRIPTNCTESRGDSCCSSCGAKEVLESIQDIAESVRKLASAVDSSNFIKGPVPRYTRSYFRHCSHAYAMGWHTSGVYLVRPDQNEPFEAFCDMETAGGGWTVVQRRVDGSVDFNRPWKDYVSGFGKITGKSGEFWLGLEKIHRLTASSKISQLRVDLANFEGQTAFTHYSAFAVGTSATEYKLVLSGYNATSTAGNAMLQATSVSFSTRDNDNDISLSRVNCAEVNKAGWWFKDSACGLSNLNGRYLSGRHYNGAKEGIYWHYFGGLSYSLKRAEMKILGVD